VSSGWVKKGHGEEVDSGVLPLLEEVKFCLFLQSMNIRKTYYLLISIFTYA
jgi:hypothetical protein